LQVAHFPPLARFSHARLARTIAVGPGQVNATKPGVLRRRKGGGIVRRMPIYGYFFVVKSERHKVIKPEEFKTFDLMDFQARLKVV